MELERRIEHTNLSPIATNKDIHALCEEATKHNFRGVCVPPSALKTAKTALEGTDQKLITVIAFPMGYGHTSSKVEAIKKAKDSGAHGVDVVINYHAAINNEWNVVQNDVEAVVHTAQMRDLEVKLIIELGAYSSRTLKQVVERCKAASPDFIKTNTGMNGNKVTLENLKLLKRFVGEKLPIKASGGISNNKFANQLIDEGATLIGASSSIQLLQTS